MALAVVGQEAEYNVSFTTNDIRNNFSDILNRVHYAKEKIALTRRGKVLAVIVPADNDVLPFVTDSTDSVGGRDNLSETVNHVHYAGKVIGIRRRNTTVAVIMNPTTYSEVQSRTRGKEEFVDWEKFKKEQRTKRPRSPNEKQTRLGTPNEP